MRRYRLTVLTPLLVGDGQRLAPIDYMVWKDQVNVLDQKKIFRLLAKGPRLDTYLNQIRRADKLDFASWGGYAQNYALRRIPFEHPSSSLHYQRAAAEHLFIPTFATAAGGGIYVPGSALKGPLRTALVVDRASEGQWKELASRLEGAERVPRSPAESLENAVLGSPGRSRTRPVLISDSSPIPPGGTTRIYLIRTSTLLARGNRVELGWKTSPRGAVEGKRAADSTPAFAEMAIPGTVFAGGCSEPAAYRSEAMQNALQWRETLDTRSLAAAANNSGERLLDAQIRYAEQTGLALLRQSLESLKARLLAARERGNTCLISFGWGTGFLSKAAFSDAGADPYRAILRSLPVYASVLKTAFSFPKTRRIVFLGDQPAALPGWAELAFED